MRCPSLLRAWQYLVCTKTSLSRHPSVFLQALTPNRTCRYTSLSPFLLLPLPFKTLLSLTAPLSQSSYKGMSLSSPSTTSSGTTSTHSPSKITPQTTGFSQISMRGGAGEGSGQAMSVLLSWHEKVVEIAGLGAIVRAMTDRRMV